MTDEGLILLVCFSALACGMYLVWPSKWNVLAHMKLAMAVVAYVIPIGFLGLHESFSPATIEFFTQVMVIGTFAYIAGLLFAKFVLNPAPSRFLREVTAGLDSGDETRVEKRIWIALIVGLSLMIISFVGMGFIPLFADDPLTAKFFRGEYKAAYDRVSIIYRLAWVILPTLIGVGLYLSFRRTLAMRWRVVTTIVIVLLFLTLSRTSIAQGVLLLVVLGLVWRKHTLFAIAVIVASYVAGALFYRVLAMFGPDVLGTQGTSRSILSEIGATVPDVTDALGFWDRWIRAGQPLTDGRTLWGGLIPGNYPWNPSVWSITLGNPNVDITAVASGGLRLPAPAWGYLNFGYPGAVIIPFIAGLASGIILVMVSKALPARRFFTTLLVLMWADVLVNNVFGVFYKVSYLTVLELLLVTWVLAAARPHRAHSRYSRSGQAGLIRSSAHRSIALRSRLDRN